MKALILEDNFPFARKTRTSIDVEFASKNDRKDRFQCYIAGSSKKALELIEEAGPFDVGIFDIQLDADSIDGIDVAKKIIELDGNAFPIIFLSAFNRFEIYIEKLKSLGIPRNYLWDKSIIETPDKFLLDIHTFIRNFHSVNGPQNIENMEKHLLGEFPIFHRSKRKIGIKSKEDGVYRFYNFEDIIFIESVSGKGKTKIHVEGIENPIIFGINIGSIMSQLNTYTNTFIKCHQGMFVNAERIWKLEGTTLYFDDNENRSVLIGDTGKSNLIKQGFILRVSRNN